MFKRIIPIVLGLGIAAICYAEIPVRVSAKAEPTRVTLGDEIRLVIEIERPQKFSLEPLPAKLPLGPFEVKSMNRAEEQAGGRIKETLVLTLTTFELGQLQIPPVSVRTKDPKGLVYETPTPLIPIQSVSVGNVTEKSDIRPIKGPLSMSRKALQIIAAVCAGLFLATLAMILWFRRRASQAVDPETLKPAHERALLELGRLQKKNYAVEGKNKVYYSELSDILRRYLERRYGLKVFEWTTAELVSELKKNAFAIEVTDKIRLLLESADLVKFAKFSPPVSQAETLEAELRTIVETTKELPDEEAKKR